MLEVLSGQKPQYENSSMFIPNVLSLEAAYSLSSHSGLRARANSILVVMPML